MLLLTVVDVLVICRGGHLNSAVPQRSRALAALTPCIEIAQVEKNAPVPVERDESSSHVIKYVQRGHWKVVYLSERQDDVYEPGERVAHAHHERVRVRHIYTLLSNLDIVRFNVLV